LLVDPDATKSLRSAARAACVLAAECAAVEERLVVVVVVVFVVRPRSGATPCRALAPGEARAVKRWPPPASSSIVRKRRPGARFGWGRRGAAASRVGAPALRAALLWLLSQATRAAFGQ
jgi:hypothetical protein